MFNIVKIVTDIQNHGRSYYRILPKTKKNGLVGDHARQISDMNFWHSCGMD